MSKRVLEVARHSGGHIWALQALWRRHDRTGRSATSCPTAGGQYVRSKMSGSLDMASESIYLLGLP